MQREVSRKRALSNSDDNEKEGIPIQDSTLYEI